jgi:AcrR family transcriptional regulator
MTRRRATDPLNPRKQPSQARSAQTVAVILEAAAHILEVRGFDGYTTNAIAERAGVSIGSLYQYFPSKDAITAALIDRESATLLDAVARAREVEDWQAAMKAMIRCAARHQLSRPKLARLLDIEEARLAASRRNPHAASTLLEAICSIVQKGLDAGSEDVIVVATDILVITRSLSDAAGERGQTDINDLQRRITRAVFGYLKMV